MKSKKTIKSLKITGTAVLAVSLLAACSEPPAKPATESKPDSGTGQASTAAQSTTYPLKTSEGFSYWGVMSTNTASFFANLGESEYGKEVGKRTGVKVKWIAPPLGNEAETFNLLIASGDLPDVVEYNWASGYPGGPEKALKDGVIVPLNDLIDKYAPNLKKALKDNPDLDKMVKTDNGKYYAFPMIRPNSLLVYKGPMIRKDWLDELGLSVPETIDDWSSVLKAFKEKKNIESPLTLIKNSSGPDFDSLFFGAYKVSDTFYIDENNKVQYGPMMPGFLEAIKMLNKWYKDGLLDRDFSLNDVKALDNKILNGKAGSTNYLSGNGLGRYLDTMKDKDPKFNLVAAPYPTLKKGEKAFIGQTDFNYTPAYSAAITTTAKNPELIVKWLDYFYGQDGILLNKYGIEGTTYKMENGWVVYTDLVVKNPEKLSSVQVLSKYTKGNSPTIQDDKVVPPNPYKQQDEANKLWSNTDALKHKLPPFITPTVEEGKEVAKVITALNSLRMEMMVKMIMGADSTDNFDKYVKQMKDMGTDKVLDIYQKALERYNKR